MRRFNDPVEAIIADALDAAGIAYVHESERKSQCLDFVVGDVAIECKRFSTPRTAKQIEDVPNVIVIQGMEAARFFAAAIAPKSISAP